MPKDFAIPSKGSKADPCDSALSDIAQKAMSSKSKRTTEELFQKAEELGVDPFEILLYIADGNKVALDLEDGIDSPIPANLRVLAAREALKYLHPTMKATEISGPGGQALEPLAIRVLFGQAESSE